MTHTGNPLLALASALEKRTLKIDHWHTPATDYLEAGIKDYRIRRSPCARGSVCRYWGMDGYLTFRVSKRIPITTLQERRGSKWYTWMIDDPPQQRAMEIYAQHMKGRVLVAGLGLGLILHELAKNPDVKHVLCLEKSADVIRLITPKISHLLQPEKGKCMLYVSQDDFYNFIRRDTSHWDHIFADLWVTNEQTKIQAYLHSVLPTAGELIVRYPGTPLTFHGFQSISVIKPVSKEMVELILRTGVYK